MRIRRQIENALSELVTDGLRTTSKLTRETRRRTVAAPFHAHL